MGDQSMLAYQSGHWAVHTHVLRNYVTLLSIGYQKKKKILEPSVIKFFALTSKKFGKYALIQNLVKRTRYR